MKLFRKIKKRLYIWYNKLRFLFALTIAIGFLTGSFAGYFVIKLMISYGILNFAIELGKNPIVYP